MNQNLSLKLYIAKLTSKYKVYLIALAIIAITASFMSIAVNYKIKEIIDAIGNNPNNNVAVLILLFILYAFLHHGVYFVGRLFDIKYKPSMLAEIVEDMFVKTVKQSLHWFDSHLSGEISSKITDLQDNILTIIKYLSKTLNNFTTILISMIYLVTINIQSAIVVLIFAAVYTPILFYLLKRQMIFQKEYVKSRQSAVGIINDSIANIFGTKIIGNIWTELKLKLTPAILNWKLCDTKARQFDAYYVDMADTILVTIMTATQIWLLTHLFQSGKITAGEFAFIAIITLNIHDELSSLLDNILFDINPKIAVIKSSYEFINHIPDVQDTDNALSVSRVKGAIEYKNVVFGYSDSKNIFNDLNLSIKSGQRVGIVGTSGAGKTTLIKCLLRYFNVRSGNILIDNQDIAEITQESLRANISIIPQDITMFHRSVLENLQLAKHDATFDEIQEACKKAKIHNDILAMPKGYDSVVGERGVKMSGGQRQRIAIARAILKNAPILILDEATSALDTPTEKLIQESINEILENNNSTIIVIAHRLSTLLHMDRILVFEKGKIVEDGTHLELLSMGGIYKSLWDAQAGGFLPDN